MATHFIRSNIACAHRMSSHNYLVTTSLDFETVHVSLAHQVAMCVCMCPGREGGGGDYGATVQLVTAFLVA